MKSHMNRQDALTEALHRLERFTTLSPFTRLFYRMIRDMLAQEAVDAPKLGQAYHVFLRSECRRHEAAGQLVRQGKLDARRVIRASRDSQDMMERLRRGLEATEVAEPLSRMVRELLLAECHYHLGQTEQVVAHLKRAVRLGGHHPLVHFALGYNTYSLAVQQHTRAGRRKGELLAVDLDALRRGCREAIIAFEAGLGDTAYDAQLYWWIGMIWEMLGEQTKALESYRAAMETDPEHFGAQGAEKMQSLGAPPRLRSQEEAERLCRLGPISDEELELSKAAIQRARTFPGFFRNDGGA